MSKKTIIFKMPTPANGRREGELAQLAAPEPGLTVPELVQASAPDRWVRQGEADLSFSSPPAKGFPIDLALERSFGEVVALSFALPAVLGWFWMAYAMDRYRRILAA